ncbi:MAG: rod shape-determining protein MreC [Steroidobacteraceae bacterium]
MAFGTGASSARGGSPGFRFTLYATLSIIIMFLDQRGAWLEQVRYALNIAAYPIQLAVSSPSTAWRWIHESVATRDALRADNERLMTRNRELELRSMRYEALAHENDQLRGLKDALPPVAERWLVAEVVDIQLNNLRQRVLVDRGTRNGVFKGQAVLDDKGLLGQTTHVGPWSAEVILITDPEHAVPVQIERTGLRTIAVGTGDSLSLALPYLPANADVKTGDVLMTSGLGGVFPAGYPVGRVVEVHRDAVQPLAQVRAEPFASMNIDREVMLVWFREGHPAAPVTPTAGGEAKGGNAAMQPQAVPPRPKPAAPAAVPAPGQPGSAPSPGDAATQQVKPPPPKPAKAATPESKDEEEGPPIEEDVPPKPEPKGAASQTDAPQAAASQAPPSRTAARRAMGLGWPWLPAPAPHAGAPRPGTVAPQAAAQRLAAATLTAPRLQ